MAETYEEAYELEKCYIKEMGTLWPEGYNLESGGRGGQTWCEKSRERQRESLLKYYEEHPEAGKERNEYRIGKKQSSETIKKRSEALLKYYEEHPEAREQKSEEKLKYYKEHPETVQKLREASTGENNPRGFEGKYHTPEAIEKIREASTGENNPMYGRKHSSEAKEKNRLAHLGKKQSPESNEKRSRTLKGRTFSRETVIKRETTKRINRAIRKLENLDKLCFPLN